MQNPSAYEVVKLLDLKPCLKVWDACAAPGGKAALMAEMDSSLEILASDVSESRVLKMRDVVDRLDLTNVRVECRDVLNSEFRNPNSEFDRILLDVPCSNMGVIARRPESVYRMTPESIKELAELQYKILQAASARLAPGGILVYATCSPDPEETTKIVNKFVKENPEFEKGESVFPGTEDLRFDGFFAQALRRK
jgi:16S rRNA (cytosine967-C5)-methyltransferase